jgi:hypothetical protein
LPKNAHNAENSTPAQNAQWKYPYHKGNSRANPAPCVLSKNTRSRRMWRGRCAQETAAATHVPASGSLAR